nr:hypothetical protein [Armatimonas sp.]
MTLTIELDEAQASRLARLAKRHGVDIQRFATVAVHEAMDDEEETLSAEDFASLGRGIADGEAGREQGMEAFLTNLRRPRP